MNQQSDSKKSVIVIGGGVAGLSAAHELACRGFAVEVYERKAVFGGKARSIDFEPRDGVVLPAEHGFRFFPGFYRHVVATMEQIPTQGGHVADHLARVSELRGVGDTATNAVLGVLPLEPIWRWSGFAKWVAFLPALVRSAPGPDGKPLTGADVGFFARKFWDFACTCPERRVQQLEQLPWSDYVQAGRSDAFGKYLSAGLTRNLVAARADRASTLTVGTIGLQLLLDALRGLFRHTALDRVLDGPTSEVWIKPWIQFLQEKGVVFHTGFELNEIELAPGTERPRVASVSFRRTAPRRGPQRLTSQGQESVPHLEEACSWLSQQTASEHAEASEESKQRREAETHAALADRGRAAAERRRADYYVFAVPIEQMSTFVTPAVRRQVPRWRSLPELAKSVEWMNGVLFYLSSRSTFPPGHTTYLDSDWALTSIFQDNAIWPGWKAPDPRVEQILSVDVSNWTVPRTHGGSAGQSASDLPRDQVIEEVWDQVKRALQARTGYVIDDAHRRYAFVDEDIEERLNPRKTLTFQRSHAARRRATRNTLLTNAEPLLVNQIGTRALRPNAAGDLENGFLASDYVLTETDLATMEGANEAARRAVNGLLERENRNDFCKLFPLKEPLEFLRRWDSARFKAGRPSPAAVRVLGVGVDWSVRAALLLSQWVDTGIRLVSRLLGRPQRLGEVAAAEAPASDQPPPSSPKPRGKAAAPTQGYAARQRPEESKSNPSVSV